MFTGLVEDLGTITALTSLPRGSGLRLRLFWPGGREPVQLDYELQEGSGLPWQGSVLLPLDRWQTLLRRGEPAQVLPRGELRSSAAQARIERELQARVQRMEP